MRAALRYRRAQALAVAVLAALVTMCLVLAPLYTRALEQAMVGMTLREAPAERSGVRLASTSATDRSLAVDPDGLAALLPASIRGDFGPPVAATSVDVRKMPLLGQPGGRLLARAGQCDHVRFTAGACPTEAFDVAISTDQAAAYGLAVGQSIEVGEFDELVSLPESAPRTTLRVVGVYDQVDGPYWFGDRLTGQAAKNLGYDTMLTAPASFTASLALPGGGSGGWFQPRYAVDLPLLPERVSSDDLDGLGSTVARLTEFPMGVENAGSHVAATVTVRSGLPAIADEMAVGRSQAAITVPLLMAQLGLLLVAVLWLILVAASDQRRAEVAVARLRGRGSRGARRLLVAETLPPVVLGVPIGAVLAVGAVSATRHTVLAFGDWVPPFELPVWAYAAALAALAGMVGLVLLSVQRVCREPVASLIRSVPPRPVGIRLGVLEGMLVASAGAAFLALATDVASALESAYGAAANVVAGVLRDAGYAVDEIVAGLHAAYQVTVTQLVELLGQLDYGVNQIASALSDVLDVTAEALAGVLKSLDYTVAQIGQSLQQVYELIDVAAAKVLDAVGYAVGEVASALHDVYRETAAIAARALEQAGFLVDEIATGLRDAYQATAAQVAQILKAIDFTANQVAGALANVYAEAAQGVAALLTGAGYVVDDIARAMTDVFNQTANEVAAVLRTVGYAIGEITRVLDDVYAQTAQGVATILRSIGYGVNEIGAALQSVLNVTADAIVGVLRDAGYAIDAIGGVLESVYNQLADQAAATLRSAGYAIAEIGTVLHSVFQQAADGAARVLLAIGATAAEINTVLSNTFNQTVAAIGSLLSSLGFTNATIAAIGGAFTSFGNDVVDFFEGLFG